MAVYLLSHQRPVTSEEIPLHVAAVGMPPTDPPHSLYELRLRCNYFCTFEQVALCRRGVNPRLLRFAL